jgi:hypothetical protein
VHEEVAQLDARAQPRSQLDASGVRSRAWAGVRARVGVWARVGVRARARAQVRLRVRTRLRVRIEAPVAGAQRAEHERLVRDEGAVVPHADAQQRLARLGGEAVHGQLAAEARVEARPLDRLR